MANSEGNCENINECLIPDICPDAPIGGCQDLTGEERYRYVNFLFFEMLILIFVNVESKSSFFNNVHHETAKKLHVLRGRLQESQNDFHWQLGGNFNLQPCSHKQVVNPSYFKRGSKVLPDIANFFLT